MSRRRDLRLVSAPRSGTLHLAHPVWIHETLCGKRVRRAPRNHNDDDIRGSCQLCIRQILEGMNCVAAYGPARKR